MNDPCVCGSQPICPACDRYPPTCPECRTALELQRRRARKETAA